MAAGGARPATEAKEAAAGLERRVERLSKELGDLEKQIYDMESEYLDGSAHCGNVLKGYDSFLSMGKGTYASSKGGGRRSHKDADRIFSGSSASSAVPEEVVFPGLLGGHHASERVGKRKGPAERSVPQAGERDAKVERKAERGGTLAESALGVGGGPNASVKEVEDGGGALAGEAERRRKARRGAAAEASEECDSVPGKSGKAQEGLAARASGREPREGSRRSSRSQR